jgi:hypothetical protein
MLGSISSDSKRATNGNRARMIYSGQLKAASQIGAHVGAHVR